MQNDTDAELYEAEDLLRAWFHWWRTSDEVPDHLPDGLHVATAAFLTVRAIAKGNRVLGPQNL